MLRGTGGSGRGAAQHNDGGVVAAPQRSRYIFKDALIVAETAPDEYTLYTIHSYNEHECVCIDIEDQSERRFPWTHIYLLNHQPTYAEGAEVLALTMEGADWLTAYYPARVYPSARYASTGAVFSVLFDSDLVEFGERAPRKELPDRVKNLYGNDVPTVILKTPALPFVPEALAYQEHKTQLKAERKMRKRTEAVAAAAAALYGEGDGAEHAAAMGLHPHQSVPDADTAHLVDGITHESAAARSLKSTSSLAEAYAESAIPNPIPQWRVQRPHLSLEQLERIAIGVLSQVGKRVRLVPSLHEFMERNKLHNLPQQQQDELQLYQQRALQEQHHQQLQQLQQQQYQQHAKQLGGGDMVHDVSESGASSENTEKLDEVVPASTFVSGIGTTARWDAARTINQPTHLQGEAGHAVETDASGQTTTPSSSNMVESTLTDKATGDNVVTPQLRTDDTHDIPKATTAPYVGLF